MYSLTLVIHYPKSYFMLRTWSQKAMKWSHFWHQIVACRVSKNMYPVFTDRKRKVYRWFHVSSYCKYPNIDPRPAWHASVYHVCHHVYTLYSPKLCVFKSATLLTPSFGPRHHARSATSCTLKVIGYVSCVRRWAHTAVNKVCLRHVI